MNRPSVSGEFDFFGAGAVSENGQVIIPAASPKRFDINAGERPLVVAAVIQTRGSFFSHILGMSQR